MFERSYHFIPADQPKLFDRVHNLGADTYIFDLEDAVAGNKKHDALNSLKEWLESQNDYAPFYIRINLLSHILAEAQRDLLTKFPDIGVVLPKLDSIEALERTSEFYGFTEKRRIIGLIENATGLINLQKILNKGLMTSIGLGLEDFTCSSIFDNNQLSRLVNRIRTEIALHAMAFGINAIDTASLDLSGGKNFQAEIDVARSTGMTSKFTIHPNQIKPVNEGFSPSANLAEKARNLTNKNNNLSLENGYSVSHGEIQSPPKLKKLHIIKEFLEHHEITR